MGRHRTEVDARGFTLLELILTLFVLALVMALALPTIGRSTDAIRARAEVAGFSAVLRHAREQAMTTQRPYAVVVDPDAHRMTIMADDKEVTRKALPPRLSIVANPPPQLTVRFEPHGVSTGGEFRLTSGGIVFRVSIDSMTGRVKADRL
jgi:prepilin-type N-terminal cleavage/methylation domain-containing protein